MFILKKKCVDLCIMPHLSLYIEILPPTRRQSNDLSNAAPRILSVMTMFEGFSWNSKFNPLRCDTLNLNGWKMHCLP